MINEYLKNIILVFHNKILLFKITAFYFNVFLKCNLFLWCKAEFFESSVSHDPSEIIIWFVAHHFYIITNVENSCAANFVL